MEGEGGAREKETIAQKKKGRGGRDSVREGTPFEKGENITRQHKKKAKWRKAGGSRFQEGGKKSGRKAYYNTEKGKTQ